MKSYFFTIFLLIPLASFSQTTIISQGNNKTLTHNKGFYKVDSLLTAGGIVLPYEDTTTVKGDITINPSDNKLYVKENGIWATIESGSVNLSGYLRKIDTTTFAIHHPDEYGLIGNGVLEGDTGIVIKGHAGGVSISGDAKGVDISSGSRGSLYMSSLDALQLSGNGTDVKGQIIAGSYGLLLSKYTNGFAKITGTNAEVGIKENNGITIKSDSSSDVVVNGIKILKFSGAYGSVQIDSTSAGGVTISGSGSTKGVDINGGAGGINLQGSSKGITLDGQGGDVFLKKAIKVDLYTQAPPSQGDVLTFNSSDSTLKWQTPSSITFKTETFTGSGTSYTVTETPITESATVFVNGVETNYTLSGKDFTLLVGYTIDYSDFIKIKYSHINN